MTATGKRDIQLSPTNSSDSMDPEFELTAEMLIEGEDFEGTLDEEEEDEIEDVNELADLQKEGDMPIEELLAMYYKNTDDEIDTINTSVDENNLHDGGGQYSTNTMEGDDANPFENQRITRGLAALNSQYFEGEYSSDEEYQPTVDDWKKEIQIGSEYQAEVADGLSPYKPLERTYDNDDKLLWKTDIVTPSQLNQYLSIVYRLTDAAVQTPDRDDEQALYTLLQTRNVERALKKRQEQERQPPDVSLWSEEECQNFEQGLRVFGKDFRLIQKNKVLTRSVGEIVQFYYLWKKTERHDAFVTQTKLGRKKYAIPGIADMMGRFLQEENESVFSSRSASPNIFDIQNTDPNTGLQIKKELLEKHNQNINNQLSDNNILQLPNGNLPSGNHTVKWREASNAISIGSTN